MKNSDTDITAQRKNLLIVSRVQYFVPTFPLSGNTLFCVWIEMKSIFCVFVFSLELNAFHVFLHLEMVSVLCTREDTKAWDASKVYHFFQLCDYLYAAPEWMQLNMNWVTLVHYNQFSPSTPNKILSPYTSRDHSQKQ